MEHATRTRCAIRYTSVPLILLTTIFLSPPVAAETVDTALLEQVLDRLAAQEEMNKQLKGRVDELEHQLASLKASSTAAAAQPGQVEALKADVDEALALSRQLDSHIDDRPELDGYFDFEYFNDDSTGGRGEFRQHHLSLHLNRTLERFRFFSEVEFEYAPSYEAEGDGSVPTARGEINAEEAWVEYVHSDLLKIRSGLNVEPGYWNVNHYPNVALSTRRPLLVRNVFPAGFVGIMGHGAHYTDALGWDYHLLVANSAGDYPGKHDANDGKAVGGGFRLHLMPDRFERFNVGIRGYSNDVAGNGRDNAWGFDSQIRKGRAELLSQYAVLRATDERTGVYVQPAVHLTNRWTAFARYDLLDVDNAARVEEYTLGANFRPVPHISLKLEFYRSDSTLAETINGLAASLVMAFGGYSQ